jgi:hypothetical protein
MSISIRTKDIAYTIQSYTISKKNYKINSK